jgi:hypothetical protein
VLVELAPEEPAAAADGSSIDMLSSAAGVGSVETRGVAPSGTSLTLASLGGRPAGSVDALLLLDAAVGGSGCCVTDGRIQAASCTATHATSARPSRRK